MGSLVHGLKGAMANSHYHPVQPQLPVETAGGADGRFHFGMPWPWENFPGTLNGVISATGDAQTTEILSCVWAPRTDGNAVIFAIWSDAAPIDVEQGFALMPGQASRLYQAQVLGTRRLLLAGFRATAVALASQSERIDRLICEWYDKVLIGEFRAPLSSGDAYAPHLETMLGTWTWG